MKPASWVLRGLVLAGMILLFFPAIDIPFTGKPPSVLLLVDNSISMSDESKQEMWHDLTHELNRLSNKYSMKTYSFSDSIKTVRDINTISFDGKSTDMILALEEASKHRTDAILMITDGRHNQSGTFPSRIGIPVWSVILGSKDAADIGIEDVVVTDSNKLSVRLRTTNTGQVSTMLRLYSQGREQHSQLVNLSSDRLTEIHLPLPRTASGKTVKIEVDSLPLEDRTDNNVYFFQPSATTKALDVMFVSSSINQDTEVLLQVLKAIPDINLHPYLEVTSGKIMGELVPNPDIIVIGPMIPNSATLIQEMVRNLSGSTPILIISSSASLPSEIKRLSPLKQKASGNNSRKFKATPIGEILLSKTPLSSLESLDFQQQYDVTDDAIEMVEINGSSAIAVKKGQTTTMAIELPTKWIISSSNRESLTDILRTSLFYLADPQGFPFTFTVNKSTAAGIDLSLFSEIEIDDYVPSAWLTPDSIPLHVMPLTASSFKLTGAPPAGEYKVKVAWKGTSFNPGKSLEVFRSLPEQKSKGANPVLVSQLANETGGEIIVLDQIENLFQSLPRRKISFRPLQTPYVVIIIGLLFLVEIWYRRRIGMP